MHQFQMCIGFVILLLGIVHSLPGDINVASQLVSREGDQRKIETRSGNVCKDSGRSRISCKFLGKKEESIRKEKCVRNTKCMKTCQKCGYHCTSGIYTATNVSATIETQNGKKCLYEIRPQSPDDLVKVSFENFNLTGNGSPCENYVEVIKDDCSKEKLCGENGTGWDYTTLTAGTNIMFVYMTNDATMPFMIDQRPHFKLKYESFLDPVSCTVQESSGSPWELCPNKFEITSPNYPDVYPHNASVAWRWSFPKSRGVNMTITDLQVGYTTVRCIDYIKISEESYGHSFWCSDLSGNIEAHNDTNENNIDPAFKLPIEEVDGQTVIRIKPDESATVSDKGELNINFVTNEDGTRAGFRMELSF